MKRTAIRTVIGLLVFGGIGLGARSAHATLWRNYASSTFASPYYASLTNVNTHGQALKLFTFTALNSQILTLTADPAHSGNTTLTTTIPWSPPFPPNMVIGVSGGTMANNQPLIDWQANGSLDQDWRADFAFPDANGAQCFILYNINSPPSTVYVMSVLNGSMTANQPIVIFPYQNSIATRPDQFWCKYKYDSASGTVVPE